MKDLNAETFINKWWSTPSSNLSLDMEEWMEQSYLDPDLFWKHIFEQENILPTSQSIVGKSYNFYHDCIIRHVKSNSIAFSLFKEKDQAENWTYEKLHHCVNFHVEKWGYYSPQPGQLMAIVATPGVHFLIGLLTAFRFGLKICYLPTNSPFLGKSLIKKYLAEINPQFVVAEEASFALEGIPLLTVNEQGIDEENHAPHSFAYEATVDMQISLSLQRQEAQTLVPLDAHSTYLHALRDALFTLSLIQHPYWATPLSCPIRTEPCSTLMSLLCGITRVYVPDEAIRKDPLILQDERISLIGISHELQKLWTHVPAMPTRYLKCYYKNPMDVSHQASKTFIQSNKLEKTPCFHLLMDNAVGGISLFSKPTLEIFNFLLKPALGTSWSLSDINGLDENTLTGFGIFNTLLPQSENNQKKGNFTFTQAEKNLMMTGTIESCRDGVTFPIVELEEIVDGLPFVEVCMVHPIKKAGSVFNNHFVLLVFVNPKNPDISEEDKRNWSTEISQQITDRLGTGFLPDQIDYFSLLPKMHIFGIDRAWCANQYNSGLLLRKKDLSHYRILSVLKKLVQVVNNSEKT